MNGPHALRQPGIAAAIGAAVLFGAGTPLTKGLLSIMDPWLLAGLLYLGSGLGLWLYRLLRRAPAVSLPAAERPWLAGAILAGGVLGPVLLMFGLSRMPASGASLLLNAESVFTALLAWFVFRENFDRRIAFGMLAIVAGAVVLSWPSGGGEGVGFENLWPPLAVLGACLAWAIDSNLTRHVSLADASWIASLKGLAAGSVNLALALVLGAAWPAPGQIAGAMVVGLLAYGISLTLFVVALRHLGTARTGAYFSTAPFIGAAIAIPLLGESTSATFWLAASLMGLGVWLHLTEHHAHGHTHEPLEHTHRHTHDEHHRHGHDFDWDGKEPHSHPHTHAPTRHTHPHFPDMHHRHKH
ncbi:MAG: EamA family transporter [Betaproteobacteria bacterium]|nr:EamA family transporter [Betaproteobacteria bacterium]